MLSSDNNLTPEQKRLYDNLKSAIEGNGDIANLLKDWSEEDLRRVLTEQEVMFLHGIKETLTLLGYAMDYYSDEKIKVILRYVSQYPILLKKVLTAQQKMTLSDGSKHTLTLLGYVMNFNDSDKEIEAILQSIDDQDLLKEILTAKQIVDGKEYTLFQYADHYAPEYATIIRKKLEAVELPIDQHTSPSTQNEQQSFQPDLQDADPSASVSAGTGPEDNDNFMEDQQQKLYDNLKSAIKSDDIAKLSSLLKNLSKEDLKRVLTVKQQVKFEGGITESLTLFGCAMNFYDGDKKIKVILEHFSQYPILLKEMLTAIQKKKCLPLSKK